MRLADIPIVINPFIPLQTWKRLPSDDYELLAVHSDTLCIRIGNEIHVHPDRMHWFEALKRRP